MIVINFSHPLSTEHLAQIQTLTGQAIKQIINIPVHFDNQHPFLEQFLTLANGIPLSSETLQSVPILVNPPSLNFITGLLLANLHGRLGYFPPILRLRSVENSLPPRFEVAEIINLQTVRDEARSKR